jgi:hypothetical protein
MPAGASQLHAAVDGGDGVGAAAAYAGAGYKRLDRLIAITSE